MRDTLKRSWIISGWSRSLCQTSKNILFSSFGQSGGSRIQRISKSLAYTFSLIDNNDPGKDNRAKEKGQKKRKVYRKEWKSFWGKSASRKNKREESPSTLINELNLETNSKFLIRKFLLQFKSSCSSPVWKRNSRIFTLRKTFWKWGTECFKCVSCF